MFSPSPFLYMVSQQLTANREQLVKDLGYFLLFTISSSLFAIRYQLFAEEVPWITT